MTSSALLAPAGAGIERFDFRDEILTDPSTIAIPRDHAPAMLEADRARVAIEPEPAPVPQFEGEVVRRRTDLQYQRVVPEQCTVPAGMRK